MRSGGSSVTFAGRGVLGFFLMWWIFMVFRSIFFFFFFFCQLKRTPDDFIYLISESNGYRGE